MDMPWLSDAKARFMQQLHSAQMPHALLLGLSQGYGGMKLAEEIAAAALCSEPTARESAVIARAASWCSPVTIPIFIFSKPMVNR